MFDKEAYWRNRNHTEIVNLDKTSNYKIEAYVISEREPLADRPERYGTLHEAEVALLRMSRKKAEKHYIRALIHKPLPGRVPPKILQKQPGDKHFAAGQNVVQHPTRGLMMVNRRAVRMRMPNRDASKPGHKHKISSPGVSSRDHKRPKRWPFPPEMTNAERMEWRRDQRIARAEAERKRQQEAAQAKKVISGR